LKLADATRPVAQLLVRLVVGTVFLTSGWGKLHGLENVIGYFRDLGIPYPELQAPFVAGVEFLGGAAVLLGLGTRLVVVPLAVTMVVAVATAKWAGVEAFTDFVGLSEVDYLVMFFALFAFGAGPLSADGLAAKLLATGAQVQPTAPHTGRAVSA
jgi:putative oxidoreductase